VADLKKKKLGRGLGALLSGSNPAFQSAAPAGNDGGAAPAGPGPQALPDGTVLVLVDPAEVLPNPKQPRRHFDEGALAELAESIRRDGLQEPIIVRRAGDKYELVSGERRCRASVLADKHAIPAVCRDISDRDMLKLGLIENIQREDLNAIEVALAYQELIAEFGWTQEQLADEVGKKRVTVTNTLRLLQLPNVVQEQVADGSLSMGHARALLALPSPSEQAAVARKAIAEGLSVRQVEQIAAARADRAGRGAPAKKEAAKDPNLTQIEDDLRRRLGTKVQLRSGDNGRGRIEIEYFGLDELDRLLALLGKSRD
jgi:ParB family chromosome partitioning protein